jgi:adenylate kinase family enzyme
MLNIALFGAPGAGKGTQSKELVKKYDLTYISTGDILRKEIAAGKTSVYSFSERRHYAGIRGRKEYTQWLH